MQILKNLKWNESKALLLLFVDRKDFNNVLKTIETETPEHAFYLEAGNPTEENSFPYIFKLTEMEEPKVFLQIMVFHFESSGEQE